MTRAVQIGAILLVAAASGVSDQKGGGKPAAAPSPRAARSNNPAPSNPAVEKGAGRRGAAGNRLPRPLGNPVQRLMAMTPEQRERVLEKLPARQQANIRQRLENFDKLPPAEKTRRLQLFQEFSNLPPEKQEKLRRHFAKHGDRAAVRKRKK